MRVLITGAAGQVGRALVRSAPQGFVVRAATREDLDIADAAAVRAAIGAFRPALLINAAAYTAVDRAEQEPDQAQAINGLGPAHLASAARELRACRMVQISTDYVFDGALERPYAPGDPTAPLSVYGQTKLEGEQAVLAQLPGQAVVLRTAWLYAGQGRNFLLTMLRVMRERGAVRVVDDQHGTPTAAHSVARAIWRIAERSSLPGILHWTDAGCASWYEFACAIGTLGAELGVLPAAPAVTPISSGEYPTAARRPARSVLDLQGSARALGLTPVPWRDSLRAILVALARAGRPGGAGAPR